MSDEPRLFAVLCWGSAGSQWLAKLLNSHPEVLCLHHVRGQWSRVMGSRIASNLDYLKLVARQGQAYRVAGDIHGVDIESVAGLREHFGDRLTVASLVRDPVLRVRSHLATIEKLGLGFYSMRYRKLRAAVPRELRSVLNTRERLFFVHVMGLVNRVRAESQLGPVFTLESLSGQIDAVWQLLDVLSQGTVDPSGVSRELWERRINRHAAEDADRPAAAVFAQLADWQQLAFAKLLHPEARDLYAKLGYDLSFL